MNSVVVLSGGMDSTVLLASEIDSCDGRTIDSSVSCLTFHYGSKHNDRENEAALRIARHYGVETRIVPLPFIGQLFESTLLVGGSDIPEGHYADLSMKSTVVPFRNGILLSIAAGYAESICADRVVFGAHAGDHAIYPDCRSPFAVAMADAIRLGTYTEVRLEAPFLTLTKREIALRGQSLGVPFEKTYSCYNGKAKHCGRCGTCFERKEALAGFDPTEYE